jgi:PAS domain-containing protein
MEEPAHVVALLDKSSHLRLQALLVDLASYQVEYRQGDALQQLWVEALEGASRGMREPEEADVKLPTFEHRGHHITYPDTSRPLPTRVASSPHVTAFFDGGAAKKLGTGGFVVFEPGGTCLTAQARYYGEELDTNNRAEAMALQELMEWLVEHRSAWGGAPAVVIFGDSQLIINFCNRRARPAVADLYNCM